MDTTKTLPSDATAGFDQIATGLRSAMTEFEKTATGENIGALFALLRPVAEVGQRALSGTIDYSRRHPVRVAVTVAALGLLFAKAMQTPKAKQA